MKHTSGYFIAIKENGEYRHIRVPRAVYEYVLLLEEHITTPKKSTLLDEYTDKFGPEGGSE